MGTPMTIRLEPDVRAAIEEFAATDDRSVSSYINRVLRTHVETLKSKRAKAKV